MQRGVRRARPPLRVHAVGLAALLAVAFAPLVVAQGACK
jgi:hypothetical protein